MFEKYNVPAYFLAKNAVLTAYVFFYFTIFFFVMVLALLTGARVVLSSIQELLKRQLFQFTTDIV